MANILQTQMLKKDPLKNVQGYDPERINVADEDTVQGRISNVIGEDSKVIQTARTRAKQQANRRGVLNSTMALQAGEQAVIESALPIASQDAATSFRAKELNQAAGNRASEFTAGERNRFRSQLLSGEQTLEQIRAQGGEQRQTIGTQTESELSLLEKRRQIDLEMQQADAATQKELLTQRGQIDTQLQELRGQQDIGAIQASGAQQRLTIGAQTQSESQLLDQRQQLELALQSADAATQKELLAQKGEIDKEITRIRADTEASLIDKRGQVELQLQSADAASQKDLLTQRGEIDKEITRLRGETEIDIINRRGEIDRQLQTADIAGQKELLNQRGELDRQLTEIRGKQELDLVQQRGQIEKDLQTADAGTRELLLARQGEIDATLQDARIRAETDLTEQRGQIEKELQTADAANRTQLLEKQGQIDNQLQVLRAKQEMELQGLRGEQAESVAKIENEYRMLLQANQSAGGFFATTSASISEILKEPDIPIDRKNQLIARETELLQAGLAVITGITNAGIDGAIKVDLNALLDYGGGATGGGGETTTPNTNTGGGTTDIGISPVPTPAGGGTSDIFTPVDSNVTALQTELNSIGEELKTFDRYQDTNPTIQTIRALGFSSRAEYDQRERELRLRQVEIRNQLNNLGG